jgi:hypothetical protein
VALPFGSACPGSRGLPAIQGIGAPIIGNAGFSIRASTFLERAPVFLGISPASASLAVGGCTVHAALPFPVVIPGKSSPLGYATWWLPIPPVAGLSGSEVYCQAGAVDPGGALFGALALTPGLRLRIGD